jgi:hypothetical protein
MSTIDTLRSRLDRLLPELQKVLAELQALEVAPTLHRVDAFLPSGRTESLIVQARDQDEAMYLAAKYAVSTHVQSTKRLLYYGPAQGSVQSMGVRANWTEPEARVGARVATEVIRNYLENKS